MDYKEKVIALLNSQELSKEQKEKLETIFPQLKESEDEKRLNQLHSWMKEFGGAEEYTEEVYAWLKSLIEKQGEQKPVINDSLKDVILSIWDLGAEWDELSSCGISKEHGTKLDFILKHWNEREPLKQIDWTEKQGENLYDKNKQQLKEHVEEKEDSKYERISEFFDGFARVKLNDKYNFINENGKLLSIQWFDFCYNFIEGFARVELNEKENFIDNNGNLLLPKQWFDRCYDFCGGVAHIKLNGKWYFIDKKGKLIDRNFLPNTN